jgi:hypothetical protein
MRSIDRLELLRLTITCLEEIILFRTAHRGMFTKPLDEELWLIQQIDWLEKMGGSNEKD